VHSHSPPKNPFLLRQDISQEQGLLLLNGDYKKMFLLVQTYLGGQSYCPPHLTPQIQCLTDPSPPPKNVEQDTYEYVDGKNKDTFFTTNLL
jgi:hypothetical protein